MTRIMPIISDSQVDGDGFFSASGPLFAFLTTVLKDGENIITGQNARAICVVELGNLIAASTSALSGEGLTASIDANSSHSPAIALWAKYAF
jgi:hypothetical protein